MTYFLIDGKGQPAGPYSFEEVRARAEAGSLARDSKLEEAETRRRLVASEVPGLFDGPSEAVPVSTTGFFTTSIEPEPPVSAPAPPTSEPYLPPDGPPPMGQPPLYQPYASYPRMAKLVTSPTRNDKQYGWFLFVMSLLGGTVTTIRIVTKITGSDPQFKVGIVNTLPLMVATLILITLPSLWGSYFLAKGQRKGFRVVFMVQFVSMAYVIALATFLSTDPIIGPFSLIGLVIPVIYLVYTGRRLYGKLGPKLL